MIIAALLVNAIAFLHAYRFTHFSSSDVARSEVATNTSLAKKLRMLLTGIDNPRPQNRTLPSVPYETITLEGTATLEGWLMPVEKPKGTVVMFHGYAGWKGELLPAAEAFWALGYRTLLIDFPGSGGSEGDDTTIGYHEAQDVRAVYDYARQQFPEEKLVLYGFSMGAVAIMRAVDAYDIAPDALVLGCPFSTMRETIHNRFRMLGVPPVVFADLLVFWGGLQHGYWAFSHNPVDYAKRITIPTLLLCGQQDQRVTLAEIERIYQALAGPKRLVIFERADHESYAGHDAPRWKKAVSSFLEP